MGVAGSGLSGVNSSCGGGPVATPAAPTATAPVVAQPVAPTTMLAPVTALMPTATTTTMVAASPMSLLAAPPAPVAAAPASTPVVATPVAPAAAPSAAPAVGAQPAPPVTGGGATPAMPCAPAGPVPPNGAKGSKNAKGSKGAKGAKGANGAKGGVKGGGPAGRDEGRPISNARSGTLMIGDSITVGMKPYLPKRMNGGKVKVDATGGIPLEEGMRRYRAVKKKPAVVDMGLFTNNLPSDRNELRSAIQETIDDARKRNGRVVWSTIQFPDRDYTDVNAMIRQMAKKNSDVMGLVDWKQMVEQHPNYVISDKIHPSEAGAKARIAAYERAART